MVLEMTSFAIRPVIYEKSSFSEMSDYFELTDKDLILTNEFIYDPFIKSLNLSCPVLFQEKYGAGEPTDIMIDAIRADVPEKINRIIAVGGGTVMDIAKVLILRSDGSTEDMFLKKVGCEKVMELIAVPTTCGTGSEVTNVSVAGMTNLGTKLGLALDITYPDAAVLIPEMVKTLPIRFFAMSSIDALIHSIEAYLSPKASSHSQLFSTKAIKMILEHYRLIVEKGLETWTDYAGAFLLASNYGGIAFGNAGCAAIHALSYPLSGEYHIAHGEANHLMFESVIRKYLEIQPQGRINDLEKILQDALKDNGRETIWDQLFNLIDCIVERKPLQKYGIKREQLPVFVDSVLKAQQRLLNNNYVALSGTDMLDIYEKVFEQ